MATAAQCASGECALEFVVPKSSQTKAAAATRTGKAPAERARAFKVVSAEGKRSARRHSAKHGKLTVTFGEVSVLVTEPTEEAVQKGVRASVRVIRDLGRRLLIPGVEIKRVRDVPVFTVDPQNPNRVIRQLNGKSEVGHFVRGEFRVDAIAA